MQATQQIQVLGASYDCLLSSCCDVAACCIIQLEERLGKVQKDLTQWPSIPTKWALEINWNTRTRGKSRFCTGPCKSWVRLAERTSNWLSLLPKCGYNDDTHLSPWLGWCIMTGATPRNIIIKESLKLESFRKKKKVRVSWKQNFGGIQNPPNSLWGSVFRPPKLLLRRCLGVQTPILTRCSIHVSKISFWWADWEPVGVEDAWFLS